MEAIKKFVVIGPESTGKSTLCVQLAQHFNTVWIPEYARYYLEKNGTDYTYDDLLVIAKGQIESEKNALDSTLNTQHSTFFIDTDMYVMKVWCEYVFNKCHNWILNRIAERRYDGYLLCNPDLPWVADNLREYPDQETRIKLYYYYKESLANQTVPWIDIKGDYEQRFSSAIQFIDALSK